MARSEYRALMMDPANCMPAQVRGTWYLLPKKKKEKKLLQLLPPPSLMAVHLQPGWDAESGCLPGFSSPLSSQERGVGDPAVFAPAQRFPRGQLQQQTPEMKTTRPGHRCDTLVACDV